MRALRTRQLIRIASISLCLLIVTSLIVTNFTPRSFTSSRFWPKAMEDGVLCDQNPDSVKPLTENAELLEAFRHLETLESGECSQTNVTPTILKAVIYSAVYDNRAGFLPYLRVLAFNTYLSANASFCLVWYGHLARPLALKVETIASLDIKSASSMYSCLLPTSFPHPKYVSLTRSKCEEGKPTAVHVPLRTKWQVDVGACVTSVPEDIDPERLLEWAELVQILGVRHTTVYIGDNLLHKAKKVVQHYEESGTFSVRDTPQTNVVARTQWAQLLANDCLLRNMYKYKRALLLVSFDDIPVPHTAESLPQALLALPQEVSSAQFNIQYFFLDAEEEISESLLRTFLFRNMVPDSEIPEHTRVQRLVISPVSCTWLEVHNHCHGDKTNQYVAPQVAVINRYAYCHLDHQMCSSLMRKSSRDTSLIQHEKVLTLRISDRMAMIKADLEWDLYS